ncbi:MAG: Rieske 2Fe-2S domain-containing protein [Rhodospirillales bacterium]|nr:Rieske 2Fe-2S domain-containing protein [Rhodospirillales bacterium]MBO6786567.1 Rieske 2Fe-2S domain-containing protein [Rhodospirillales bacterium]
MDSISEKDNALAWTEVLASDELGETPRVVKHGSRQIAVFRSGSDIYACNNRCPHEGYPLAEGTLSDGCVLTCNWHNWKFDLSSGETLIGGDRLRRYPVREEGGKILVDLSAPPASDIIDAALHDLLDSFDDHEYDRMAREIARVMKAGGDPMVAVHAAVNATYDRFEYGTSHTIAVAADWLALYRQFAGDPSRQLTCITEIVAYLAWDTRRQKTFPYPRSVRPYDQDAFVAAIERENEEAAIAFVRGGLRDGLGFDDFYEGLARAALAHYQDFGHALIYVLKSREFVAGAGPETLEPVLLMLVRSLVYATREDLIPEFKSYAPALDAWTGGEGVPDSDVLRASGVAPVLHEISRFGGDHIGVYNALVDAAAWQMLHMDLGYSLATTGPVQDNVGWLDFTHALTFANAVRRVCSDFPALWPAGLLQIGCFLGRNGKYVDTTLDTTAWSVDDPLAYVREQRDGVVDHGQFEYIVAAHILKLSHAMAEEIEAQPDAVWTRTAAAALNRFLNSPLKRKHPLRTARQALEMVKREG